MIHFSYTNDENITLEEKEKAKIAFLEKLGSLKDEFDRKNGTVEISFAPPDGTREYEYFFDVENRDEFTKRWNEVIRQYSSSQDI